MSHLARSGTSDHLQRAADFITKRGRACVVTMTPQCQPRNALRHFYSAIQDHSRSKAAVELCLRHSVAAAASRIIFGIRPRAVRQRSGSGLTGSGIRLDWQRQADCARVVYGVWRSGCIVCKQQAAAYGIECGATKGRSRIACAAIKDVKD